MPEKGNWVTWRKEIKVLDCTIRDGGLMNKHRFDDTVVRAVYQACVSAGVDYMELGYRTSKKLASPDEYGPWKFCDEEDIRRIVGDNCTDLKLAIMADAERTDFEQDILPAADSVIDLVRVATYIHQIPTAIAMIQDAHEKGYETTVNLMAVSAVHEDDLDAALRALVATPVQTIYLVDSFGSLYSEEIHALMRKYVGAVQGSGKQVGFHGHNNQQLAYANTIDAIVMGANWLDATVLGLGRGAGNCPLELLLGFLRNPKYRQRPILACIQDHVAPLRQTMTWGYDLPYMITGQLNQHPRAAIEFIEKGQGQSLVDFYDYMTDQA
ncbi:MAG TPA: aldolase catalytic domain-containing protein [Armatimonadota bacterium]|nr:aldolase catalytic domain-containing protein [Armatimonadota bacterium]